MPATSCGARFEALFMGVLMAASDFSCIFKARAKRGPSLFEVSDHRGIGASPVIMPKVAFVFGVFG